MADCNRGGGFFSSSQDHEEVLHDFYRALCFFFFFSVFSGLFLNLGIMFEIFPEN